MLANFTPAQLRTGEAIRDAVEQLDQAIVRLRQGVAESTLCSAHTFALPRVEGDERYADNEPVVPQECHGDEAFSVAMSALGDWYGDGVHSTKVVHRVPGVVAFHTDQTDFFVDCVKHINELKDSVQRMLLTVGNHDQRFELLHALFPMIINKQLTRHITLVHPADRLVSVTFSWGRKDEIKKLTAGEAADLLARYYNARPLDLGGEGGKPWKAKVDEEIARIRSLPANTELRWRRELKPRPLVNLRFSRTEEEKARFRRDRAAGILGRNQATPLKTREGHTPLLVMNPASGYRVGKLGTFVPDPDGKPAHSRSGLKIRPEPISNIAPLFALRASG